MSQQTQESDVDAAAALAAGVAFRRASLQLRANYLREFADLWPILSTERDLNRWLRLNVALTRRWQARTRPLALEYYERQRELQSAPRVRLEPVKQMPDEQIIKTLVSQGPAVARRARLVGLDDLEAWERAEAASMSAGGRLVLNGGRDALAQQSALGWMRVSDGDPCYWCAMLVGRGAVYSSAFNAGEQHEYHNKCGCTVAPIFARTAFMSPEAMKYRAIFNASYPDGGMAAYRKAYDAQRSSGLADAA